MLKLHTRRNTTYQCTEITDIIHGVFNSGCSLFMWSGVHGLDECPVIHLLGTCARVLSIWTRLVPMWVRFVKFARNCFKMHTLSVRSRCIYLITGVHSKRLVMDTAQCQFSSKLVKKVSSVWQICSPKGPDARDFCAKKLGWTPKTIGCHYWCGASPIIPECRSNANQYDLCSPQELFNVCFLIASSVFVCLLLPELERCCGTF